MQAGADACIHACLHDCIDTFTQPHAYTDCFQKRLFKNDGCNFRIFYGTLQAVSLKQQAKGEWMCSGENTKTYNK